MRSNTPDKTVGLARRLRQVMSPPEVRLWEVLRRRRAAAGWRFRRQHPIGPFVLDFYCAEARLAVEVDGADHGFDARRRRDNERDAWLLQQGIETERVQAIEVRDNLDGVWAKLVERVGERAARKKAARRS